MNATSIVGVIGGAALLLTAIGVFIVKREFPSGGVTVTFVALALIGLSQWSTMEVRDGTIRLSALQARIDVAEAGLLGTSRDLGVLAAKFEAAKEEAGQAQDQVSRLADRIAEFGTLLGVAQGSSQQAAALAENCLGRLDVLSRESGETSAGLAQIHTAIDELEAADKTLLGDEKELASAVSAFGVQLANAAGDLMNHSTMLETLSRTCPTESATPGGSSGTTSPEVVRSAAQPSVNVDEILRLSAELRDVLVRPK